MQQCVTVCGSTVQCTHDRALLYAVCNVAVKDGSNKPVWSGLW